MKSHSTLRQTNKGLPAEALAKAGFSLIELMIVIAIVGVLAAAGVVVGFDSFSRYNFYSEADKVAALLASARSKSINNIARSQYGVYFGDADYLILFKGASYGANPAHDFKLEKARGMTYDSSACTDDEMKFSQLSGDAAESCQVALDDGVRSVNITLNNEGGLTY